MRSVRSRAHISWRVGASVMTTSLPEAEHTIEYTEPLPVCRKYFEQLEMGVNFSNDQLSGKDTANKLTKCHERKEGAIPVHGEENLSCVRRFNPPGGGGAAEFSAAREVRTQLIPITRPLLFHNSPYGGSKPTASRTAAMIPTTNTGVSFPLWYIGCFAVSTRLGWGQKNKTHPDGQN